MSQANKDSDEHQTNADLLNRLSENDELAAMEVFSRYSQRLLTAARQRLATSLSARVDPEDIVQSTFKSFFRRAGNGGYFAPESGDLFNLLVVIAMRKINARADQHLAASRDIRRTKSSHDLPIADLQDEQGLRELCLTIDDLCAGLAEVQRAIILARLEGYSVNEIAQRCSKSKRTVERELQNFREILSKQFEA